jgi:hypothetical protein
MIRFALVTIALLAACGPSGRDPGTPDAAAVVDAPAPRPDTQAAQCYEQTTEVEVALQIQIQQSCAIWNSLAELSGRATVTKSGTTLTIDFGNNVVFSGTLINGTVNLVYAHQHTFTDGCGWKATETLAGQLDATSCNFTLSYDYVESVVINNGGCATPCSAQANVQLELKPVIL